MTPEALLATVTRLMAQDADARPRSQFLRSRYAILEECRQRLEGGMEPPAFFGWLGEKRAALKLLRPEGERGHHLRAVEELMGELWADLITADLPDQA